MEQVPTPVEHLVVKTSHRSLNRSSIAVLQLIVGELIFKCSMNCVLNFFYGNYTLE